MATLRECSVQSCPSTAISYVVQHAAGPLELQELNFDQLKNLQKIASYNMM